MKKWPYRTWISLFTFCLIALTGCSRSQTPVVEEENPVSENTEGEEREAVSLRPKEEEESAAGNEAQEPEIIEADWSGYFDGLNGAAVVYDASENRYLIYNEALAQTRRSPCSTFKIISSLAALEEGLLHPEQSTRTWSGETFWNEQWNQDIDFPDAFRASCVWYFREVMDEIGQERMQAVLKDLSYGNCDISDWEGQLNTNNNNRDRILARIVSADFSKGTDRSDGTHFRRKFCLFGGNQKRTKTGHAGRRSGTDRASDLREDRNGQSPGDCRGRLVYRICGI